MEYNFKKELILTYEHTKEILLKPTDFFSKMKKIKTQSVITYFLVVYMVIYGGLNIIFTTLSYYSQFNTLLFPLTVLLTIIVEYPLSILIMGGSLHVILSLLKIKSEIEDALKISIYYVAPLALMGWLLPIVPTFWSIYLLYKGIKINYKFTTSKATGITIAMLILSTILSLAVLTQIGTALYSLFLTAV